MRILLLVMSLAIAIPLVAGETEKAAPTKCCYTHPDYVGVCVVQPAKGETCKGILAYLNTPGTVGKTYCTGSRLRGGWKQVPCKEEKKEEAKKASGSSR